MKKVKFILASIAILATIGGALAFKSKNTYTGTVWTSTTNIPSSGCTNANSASKTSTTGTGTSYYYTTVSGGSCSSAKAFIVSDTK